jgi:predicted esterase
MGILSSAPRSPVSRRLLRRAAGLSIALLAGAAGAWGQASPAAPVATRGAWTERVVTAADPEQSYALYLPTAYDPARPRPLLLVMDARGRALAAGRRFEAGAERFGWVVVSAYGTSSDFGWEPNQRALAAVLPDVEKRLAVDKSRLYLAGFSGTVRVGWILGETIPGTAGLIAASGGTPTFEPPETAPPFAVFATAGARDFNHREMLLLTGALERLGAPHRLEVFDGRHQWPPEELATEAIAWLELRAMRSGLRPVDETLIASILTDRLAAARAETDPLVAHDAGAAILRDFDGWVDTPALAAVREAHGRSSEDPAVREARRHRDRLAAEEGRYQESIGRVVGRFRGTPLTEGLRLRRDLDVDRLLRAAEDDTDPKTAASASRRLAMAYSQLSFYLPRLLAEDGSWGHAAEALELAHELFDGNPQVLYQLAVARAHLGRADAALDALEQALETGFGDPAAVRAEPAFEGLRESERFRELTGG